MFYYLLKGDSVKVHESNLSQYDARMIYGESLVGCFGRLDYAEIWRDFHNGVINREELRNKLDTY